MSRLSSRECEDQRQEDQRQEDIGLVHFLSSAECDPVLGPPLLSALNI